MNFSLLLVLLRHIFQQFQRFFQFRICGVALQHRPDAVTNMDLQNLLIGTLGQNSGPYDLIGNIYAVAIFRDHLQDTVQLAPCYFQFVDNIAPLGLHAVFWTLASAEHH